MTKTLTERIDFIQTELDVIFAEVVKFEKKLEIATKALEEYAETDWWWRAKQALKEMEGVK